MSLYKEFVESSTSYKIEESDNYFFTYINIDNVFFIKSIYIKPDSRKSSLFLKLIRRCEELADSLNCNYVSCQLYEENPIFVKLFNFCVKYGFFSEHYEQISKSYFMSKCIKPVEQVTYAN